MKQDMVQRIIVQRRLVNRIIRDRTLVSWVELSLTVPQVKSLFYVSRKGRVNISGLATGIRVTPGNVTGIVDRLVEQKLLSRTPDDGDRRVLWLEVTRKGQSLVDELREGRANEVAKVLDKLSEEELKEVACGFELLARAARAYQEEHNGEDD